ncbi:MAG: hypothetical protein AAF184_08770 [Pseudomonadota bacterium]
MDDRWKTSWDAFAREVASRFNSGEDDAGLSSRFGGKTVRWFGVIAEMQLSAQYAPGISLRMPSVRLPVRGDVTYIAEQVFVGTTPELSDAWRDTDVGDEVEFDCEIGAGNELFPGIRVSVFEEEKECFLELALERARLRCVR